VKRAPPAASQALDMEDVAGAPKSTIERRSAAVTTTTAPTTPSVELIGWRKKLGAPPRFGATREQQAIW